MAAEADHPNIYAEIGIVYGALLWWMMGAALTVEFQLFNLLCQIAEENQAKERKNP